MRGMQLFAVIALLVGVAESRSVRYDLLSLVKNAALSGTDAGTHVVSLQKIAGENGASGEAAATGNADDSKVGLILFGNIEDLKKYQIELNDEVSNNRVNIETISNSAYEAKENSKYLVINPKQSEEKEEVDDYKEGIDAQEEVEKVNYNNVFKILDGYDEDEELEEFETVDETESNDNTGVDIFSEDEYNEYDDKYNAAEEEPSEEDGSEEEGFYDEDEKYYEDETNKFIQLKNNEEESLFDGIFMEDS